MTDDLYHLLIIIGGLFVLSGPWFAQALWLAGVGVELWWRHGDPA